VDKAPDADARYAMNSASVKNWLTGNFTLKRLIISLLEIYVIIVVYVYFVISDGMIFPSRHSGYPDGPDILKIQTSDGGIISAVYLSNTNAAFTILHSHGNAEDLGDIRPILEMFHDAGFAVFSYDYRGYGTSDGKPSARHAQRDAEAAYRYLVETLRVAPERIIVHGRSVGAALALHVAAREPVAGVILESPFVSAFQVLTVIRVSPLDKFRNIDLVRKIHQPILIIHGTRDQTIPFWHGQELYDAANEPKSCLWVNGAAHDDVMWVGENQYWDAIGDFAGKLKVTEGTR
jgi:abhydrolase domain-containing protein 17